MLRRRQYGVEVIWAGLLAAVRGGPWNQIAARLGVPYTTVREWLRRFARWLVADHRHAHGRNSGAEPGSRRARARMMDHRRHSGEEPVVRHLTDNDRIVGRLAGLGQAYPACLDHHPHPGLPSGPGGQVAEAIRVGGTVEGQVKPHQDDQEADVLRAKPDLLRKRVLLGDRCHHAKWAEPHQPGR